MKTTKEDRERMREGWAKESKGAHLLDDLDTLEAKLKERDELLTTAREVVANMHDEIVEHVNKGQKCYHCKHELVQSEKWLADFEKLKASE